MNPSAVSAQYPGDFKRYHFVAEQSHAGKTVLVVSHALGEVAQVCDRLAVLVEGRLAYLGPLDSLLLDPATGEERSLEAALKPIYDSDGSTP